MTTEHEVDAALEAAAEQPSAAARVQAMQRVVRMADELGQKERQVEARLELGSAMYYTPQGPHELPTYAWLLAALDGEPISDEARGRILWMSKWALTRILTTPDVPLEVMRRTYADVSRRMRNEGATPHAYALHHTFLALDVDGPDETRRWLATWRGAARDDNSDCLACEGTSLGEVLHALGDDQGAIAAARPVMDGEQQCPDQPQSALSRSLDWFMRAGDPQAAARAHVRGWRLVSGSVRDAGKAARHLIFLARAGHPSRALRLLLPRLNWLEDIPDPSDRMWFAASAAGVLEAAQADGILLDQIEGEPADQVLARLRQIADDLAVRFDARNETPYVSQRLRAATTPEPYAESVDLSEIGEVGRVSQTASVVPQAAHEPAEDRAPQDPSALATAMRVAINEMDWAEASSLRQSWLGMRDEALTADTVEWAAVSFLDRQAATHVEASPQDDFPAADDLRTHALSAADKAGHRVEQLRSEVALIVGGRPPRSGLDPADVDALRERADELVAMGEPEDAAAVWLRLAHDSAPPDQLFANGERAASLFLEAGQERWAVAARLAGARALLQVDPARADTALEEVAADARRLGCVDVMADAVLTRSDGLAYAGEHEKSMNIVRTERDSLPADSPMWWPFSAALCDGLVNISDWETLHGEASNLLAMAAEDGSRVRIAFAQRLLGLALYENGRPLEGAESLELALPVLKEANDSSYPACLWALGGALYAIGETKQSADAYAEAATAFTREERTFEATRAHSRAGGAYEEIEDYVQASAHLDVGAEFARANGDLQGFLSVRRARADVLSATDGADAGIAALDATVDEALRFQERDDVSAEIAPDVLAASVARQGVYLLANHGEWVRAADRAARASQLFVPIDPAEAALLSAQQGAYLARADRPAEAEPILRAALDRLREHEQDDARVSTAGSLARVLDALGRPEEADAVWSEHNPDED